MEADGEISLEHLVYRSPDHFKSRSIEVCLL